MKLAVVGVVIGIAIAVTLLFATSGTKTEPTKVETDRANAAITVAKCDSGMATLSAEIGKALKDPATLRQQVSQILVVHQEVCTKAANNVRVARQARPDNQLDTAIKRMDGHLARLQGISQAFDAYEVALGSAELEALAAAAR
ncbi:MAG TPA: hypothetical protein VLB44_05660 [Kofleriaceae bacterium]|nr:hypothetical protein [Kofleriaceae bacterium]